MGSNDRATLESQGYILIKKWKCGLSTAELAQMIGTIIDVEKVAAGHKISTVQTLTPRVAKQEKSSTYSDVFGLSEFPLHSDYAHWETPPRYLMLRCIVGGPNVDTYLLPTSRLLDGNNCCISRAVVVPRRKHSSHPICTFPVVFSRQGITGIRWDFLFLKPVNAAAAQTGELVISQHDKSVDYVNLVNPFDTLIIDNWRTLHGRSSVPTQAINRRIERIYLSYIR